MRTLITGLCVLTLGGAGGCTDSSSDRPQAGTPPASEQSSDPVRVTANKPVADDADANKPVAGDADKTFSLSMPFESVELTQGEEKSMLIGINRGENFREEVEIEVSDLPQGVTLETDKPVIQQGDTDAELMLKAGPDAALGDFTFTVKGRTTSSGADFSEEVNLTVAEK